MPTCEDCTHFKFYSAMGPLEGWCEVIPSDTPDMPGQIAAFPGKKVRFDTDAGKCPKIELLSDKVKDSEMMTHMDKYYWNPDQRYGKEELKRPTVTKSDELEVSQQIDEYITRKQGKEGGA